MKTATLSTIPITIILILAALFFWLVAVAPNVSLITFTHHARTSHAEAFNEINNCFDGGGNLSPWFLMGKRYAQFCNDGGRNNFWRITTCENGEMLVVTQFKQALRKLGNYLTNKGAVIVDGPPCR